MQSFVGKETGTMYVLCNGQVCTMMPVIPHEELVVYVTQEDAMDSESEADSEPGTDADDNCDDADVNVEQMDQQHELIAQLTEENSRLLSQERNREASLVLLKKQMDIRDATNKELLLRERQWRRDEASLKKEIATYAKKLEKERKHLLDVEMDNRTLRADVHEVKLRQMNLEKELQTAKRKLVFAKRVLMNAPKTSPCEVKEPIQAKQALMRHVLDTLRVYKP